MASICVRYFSLVAYESNFGLELAALMLSINECKKILNQKEQKYTTEQINEIRDSLNKLAEIIYLEKTNFGNEIR